MRMGSLSQYQAPGVAIGGFRQLAPIHNAGEKRHITVVDLAGQRIFGGKIGKHLLAQFAERFDQLIVEASYLDTLVSAQEFERLDVLGVELGERSSGLGLCSSIEQCTLRCRECVPQRLVD